MRTDSVCCVYKGRLADGTLVEIKRLKKFELYQFQSEVELSNWAEHRNILKLRGFCTASTDQFMIVYPYMANGSLASCLRERHPNEPPLDWWTRKRIALGSARGLCYLHQFNMIHRDVKAASIYLNEDFEAFVGDFGSAKLMDHQITDVPTLVRGTIGHVAPEYISTGKVSEKADVFGYGIMLLELITAQTTFDLARYENDEDLFLIDWMKRLLKEEKQERIVDPALQDNCVDEEVEQLIQIALLCTQFSPLRRPEMMEVLRLLEGDDLSEKWGEWQKVELDANPTYDRIMRDSFMRHPQILRRILQLNLSAN